MAIPAVKLIGNKLEVRETETGHLIWRLKVLEPGGRKEMVFQIEETEAEKWNENKIRKLHQRLGHASKEKLIQLIDSSEKNGICKLMKRFIQRTAEKCGESYSNTNQGRRNKCVT